MNRNPVDMQDLSRLQRWHHRQRKVGGGTDDHPMRRAVFAHFAARPERLVQWLYNRNWP